MERRDFLKKSALASSMMMMPSFLKAFEGIPRRLATGKKLVIIQLSGGNDGLNTIVPFRDDIYYQNRSSIAIGAKDVLKLTDDIGLHSAMGDLKWLYDQGYLTIINNVGYPNPDRSHFRSTDIWQTASNSNEYFTTGWLGRYLDHYADKPYEAIEVDEIMSLVMKGKKMNGVATQDANILYKTSQAPFFNTLYDVHKDKHLSEHNLGYLYKTFIEAKSSAAYIYETSKTFRTKAEYPQNPFGRQLRTVSEFINSGLDTSVYYVSLDGFDTHANQSNRQERLLQMYAEGVKIFVEDLKNNGTFDDTLIFTFSEFGRRLKQNAANGTDHGAANNVFVIGNNLKKQGLYNPMPDLSDLDENGDIQYKIDFRNLYATMLKNWLDVDPSKVLLRNFNTLDIL